MPFALVTIGLIMIVAGVRNTHADLGAALVQDFTGQGNFTWWLLAIGAVGAVGYATPLRGVSRAFMALIVIVMLLSNGGFFAQLQSALQQGPQHPQAAPLPTGGNTNVSSSGDFAKTALTILPFLA